MKLQKIMRFQLSESNTLTEKCLPHNFLAEKKILSCLLLYPEVIETVSQLVSPRTFYFKNHQDIYNAILIMSEKELPVDILTIATFLQENGFLNKVGGVKVLLELINQIPDLMYLEEYIRLIKEKFVRRSLIKLGYEIIHSSYVTNISLENIFNDLETELLALNSEINKPSASTSGQILNSIFLQLKEKFLNPGLPGLSSGFKNLDTVIEGFQCSDLIIVAGRPSMGKTAFSLSITLNVIQSSNLPVVFFSLEMSKEQIMYRILAMETGISQSRLKNGQLYQNDWIKLNKVIKIVSKLPFFIDDSANLSIQDVRSKLKIITLEQRKTGLVIIDYLQLMQGSRAQSDSRVDELSKITRQLKNIAKEFDVPIIALSQLSRNVENRISKKPILSDLRESGSIEQDADLVLMLSKEQQINKSLSLDPLLECVEIAIAKHRNGPTGLASLKFDKKRTRFSD